MYEFRSESTLYSLPECQGTPSSKQALYLKFKWQQRDSIRTHNHLVRKGTLNHLAKLANWPNWWMAKCSCTILVVVGSNPVALTAIRLSKFLMWLNNSHMKKHQRWSLFLTKLQACKFIKNRLQHRFSVVNIEKFLRTTFRTSTSGCFWR